MAASDQKVIAIIGPTAAGKSSLAVMVADAVGGEIISCDALQLRAGLPLLTAKPTVEDERVRHHLVGVLPMTRPATAAQYVALADRAIGELATAGKNIVICGGTGLYLRALVMGLSAGPAADAQVRKGLREEAQRSGTSALHRRLVEVDQDAAARIAPADYVRIERALEVYLLTGRPISEWHAQGRKRGPRYDVLRVGLDPGVAALGRRIETRVQAILDAGVCQEVADLAARVSSIESPPLGYDAIRRYLGQEHSLPEMKKEIIAETMSYAKRQRTWFRREPDVIWIEKWTGELMLRVGRWLKSSASI